MSTSKQQHKSRIEDLYNVGDFIDAKDSQGNWCVGYIVDKNQMTKTFKVRFDGWAAKYDQFYRFNNPKLKQFRSIVYGYTGQKQNPGLRPGWKFSLQELHDKLYELVQYLKKGTNKHIQTAHHFNQYIRGHNYLYVDFLMTINYSTEQEFHKVLQFFKLNVTLSVQYLTHIINNFDKFTKDLSKQNNQHLQNIEIAKNWAFYEIFDMVYTIAGNYPRFKDFFRENQELIRKEFQLGDSGQIWTRYNFKITQYFFKSQGFILVTKLLEKISDHKGPISFIFLNSLAHFIAGLCKPLTSKMKQPIVLQLQQIIMKSLQLLGDNQMKDLNPNEIINMINQIQFISKNTKIERQIHDWSPMALIQVYFKMISCPFFQKKLKGITSLHQFIDKNVEQKKQEQEPDIIADGRLMNWIDSKKFFDVLFTHDNPQLIKKSTELIKYLYHRDNQMQKYIQIVWKYREGKHETALKEIYNFMGEIPYYDKNQKFTKTLFNKSISKLQQTEWDPEYLKMIKDYTINALQNSASSGDFKQTYGYEMIYKYALKNQSDETYLNYLIQILEKIKQSKIIQKYVTNYFLCIQNNVSSKLHVSLLLKILNEKIIDIRSIKLDCQEIILNRIVQSKNSMTQNLQSQFQLLSEFLKQKKEVILQKNLINLWNQMVNSKTKTQFFKWIYKIRYSGKVFITNLINQETKYFLLQNFWNDEYILKHQIDQNQAVFLLQLFKFVNDKQEKIKRSNLVFEVVDQKLLGVNKIFAVYLSSKNPKVEEILSKGLAEIYYSGSESLLQSHIDLLGIFINEIVIMMRDFLKNNNIQGVKKMLRLVQQLILRDEQILDNQQTVQALSLSNILVKNLQTNEQKLIKLNPLKNVYSIKQTIASTFNLQMNKFDLILNEEDLITYQSYFRSLGELDMKAKIWIKYRHQQTEWTKIHLNRYLDQFFELLGNKEIQQTVWNIVNKLPTSNDIKQKILMSQNSLQILANTDSFYKELYMFKVALTIQTKWWNLSVQQMTSFFISKIQKITGSTEIQRQYIWVCGKLLQNVLKKEQHQNQKLLSLSFLCMFGVSKKIINLSNQIQNINIFNVKTILQTFFSIGEQLNNHLVKNDLINKSLDAMSLMLNQPQIQEFLKLSLIQLKNDQIRGYFPVRLITLIKYGKENWAQKLAHIILDDLLDSTISLQTNTLTQYITFSYYVLESVDIFLKQFYKEKKSFYFKKIFQLIQSQYPQKNSQTINMKLKCYLSIVKFVLKQVPMEQLNIFFQYLYKKCLFNGNLSKCKTKDTRTGVFNIFIRLIKANKLSELIYSKFSIFHQNGLWRTRRLDDWTISQTQRMKSSTNYVGLRNLGCICYMNSFFQQIFMVKQFRKALLLAQDPQLNPKTTQDNLLYQIKKMFMNLTYSDKKAYDPKSFCLSFKDYEGNPTNVNQQMDIDEFSGILFDRIQNQLKGTKSSQLIKNTFGGVYSNQIICKGCPHFSETEQSFISLGLTVKDKRSIYESLETMIKGDTLDGDNAYYCERCDKKVSAVKRVCLKKLPNYLIVALKRFQFDYTTMSKQKVNDYCEFPQNLNLQEYSYQYLRESQKIKISQQDQQIRDKKYYQYRLKGVVIHIGHADSGHYYSLIQERSGEERWIEFNDTIVRKFNIQNLNDEAFGGQTGGAESKQKIKNAYLLVYQRVQKINSLENQLQKQGDAFKNMEMYSEILQKIQQQNSQYNIENVLFSAQYTSFIQSLINEAAKNKSDLYIQKFIISAIFTVIIRSKSLLSDTFDILRNVFNLCCKGNKTLCEFILSQFCDMRIYEQFFRSCPLRQTKRNIATWLGLVLRQVDEDVRQNFIKLMIFKISKQNENNFQALTILHNFVQNDKSLKLMLEYNVIGRLLQNVIRKQPRVFGIGQFQESEFRKKQAYFGYEQIIEKTPFQLKKIKYDNESGYVWAVINKIISKFPLQQLPNLLHPKQLQLLYLPKDKIYKILEQIKNKFDIDVFTDLLAYLSQDQLEFSEMLFELIEKGLKQFQSKRYRQFFVLFQKLISVQDNLVQERVAGIFNLMRSLKENQKYAMDCTIIQLWICKVINENQTLRNYLIHQRNILRYLANLPLSKVPSDELAKKNINFIDTSISKLHGIPFPPSRRGYIKVLKQVEQFYQKLLNKQYEAIGIFQSGKHIVYQEIVPGIPVAYFDVKDKVAFEEATVKEVFSDKVLISRKNSSNKTFWVWKDDQKLTLNLKVIKSQNPNDRDSSKTTEMEDQIDFESIN